MRFDVITLFPEMFMCLKHAGLIGQALEKGIIELGLHNPRKFAEDPYKSVDDRPFGGGDGMVMLARPLALTIEMIKDELQKREMHPGPVIYLSPVGEKLTVQTCEQLQNKRQLTLVCGRYGGVDQRLINRYVDMEVSIGDYILNGGELPAMVLIESVSRLIPGVMGNEISPRNESFFSGLLEAPQFTRPRDFADQGVPEILLSGHHKQIEQWHRLVSILLTEQRRPELLDQISPEELDQAHQLWKSMGDQERALLGLTEREKK